MSQNNETTGTLFQTAQERHPRNVWSHDPSVIFPLHEEPEPDYIETIACSSGSPEDVLIALEELEKGLVLECIEQQLATSNNTGWRFFEEIAPTTTNLKDTDRIGKVAFCRITRMNQCS
tara:strand:- start:215 stop:571 length:357 start_codon:yes stop_codon:yes gene_type:complete